MPISPLLPSKNASVRSSLLSVFCCIREHLPTLWLGCQLRIVFHGSVACLTSFGVPCDYDLPPVGWPHLGMREHRSLSHLLIRCSVGDTDVAINFLEMVTCLSSPGIVAGFSDLISQEQGFGDTGTEAGGTNDLVLSYVLLILSTEEANH